MKVIADIEVCIGAGQCVLAAPDLFDQDDKDGRVIVLEGTDGTDDDRRRAVECCPSGALRLAED